MRLEKVFTFMQIYLLMNLFDSSKSSSDGNSSKFIHELWELDTTTEQWTASECQLLATEKYDGNNKQKRSEFNNISVTTTKPTTPVDLSRFSDEFRNCSHTPVEQGCYRKFNNETVYVPEYDKYFEPSDYIIHGNGILYICPIFFPPYVENEKFSTALEIVTIVGIVISSICIILHMLMFIRISKLRNLPGYSLFSLCVALLVAYSCWIILYAIPKNADCSAVGIVRFYSFLASFFWMNIMSFDVWRSLRMATSKLMLSSSRRILFRFVLYSLYSWGVPLLILITALIVDAVGTYPKYKLKFNPTTCWFQYKQALFIYFALPLFSLLFLNVVFYISSFFMIHNATMNTSENKADLWSRFLVSMRLAVAMGLMWIFGVLATATQATVLWYFYAICNTLQGVFIFFSFTLSEKSRKECRTLLQKKKISSLPTQMSSQQMTSFQSSNE